MNLNPFAGTTVKPGEPVTAQGWNEIVDALQNVLAFLNASAGTSLSVHIENADADPAKTRVVAIAANGEVIEAVAPTAETKDFTLRGLVAGAYKIEAEAPGFKPVTKSVTVPTTQPVSLSMESAASFMPLVFGQKLQDALAALSGRKIVTSRVVDISGREVAPANPGPEYVDTVVLAQLPDEGDPVPPGQTAKLVVSASLVSEPTVDMPSLAGLTLAEVQQTLTSLGLTLGTVKTQ